MLEKVSLKRKWQTLKYLLRKFAKHIADSTSFTKTVKLSIKICSKMILIGNYTCSRSIDEKSHLCLAKYLRTCGIINISPNTRAIFH